MAYFQRMLTKICTGASPIAAELYTQKALQIARVVKKTVFSTTANWFLWLTLQELNDRFMEEYHRGRVCVASLRYVKIHLQRTIISLFSAQGKKFDLNFLHELRLLPPQEA